MSEVENLWGESLEDSTIITVKELLEEQAVVLREMTKGVVFAEIKSWDDDFVPGVPHECIFKFSFVLGGKFLPDYRCHLFSFASPFELYPSVIFNIDRKVTMDAFGLMVSPDSPLPSTVSCSDHNEARWNIGLMLKTDRVRQIIGAIRKLSK